MSFRTPIRFSTRSSSSWPSMRTDWPRPGQTYSCIPASCSSSAIPSSRSSRSVALISRRSSGSARWWRTRTACRSPFPGISAAMARSSRPSTRSSTDISATEREDRLLGIADDEQLAGMQEYVWPGLGQSVLMLGQKEEDLVLNRIGVLKLIHEDGLEQALQPRPDVRVGLQQVAGAGQEPVDPDVARSENPSPARRAEGLQQPEQVVEEGVIARQHRLRGPDQIGGVRKLFLAPTGRRLRASVLLLQQRPQLRIQFRNARRAAAEHVAEQTVCGSQQRFDLTRLLPSLAGN